MANYKYKFLQSLAHYYKLLSSRSKIYFLENKNQLFDL